jgi:hypothetical protein
VRENDMTETFLPYLPIPAIRAAYAAGRGDELGSGKIDSAESSAALVANTFGLFLDRPADMPPLPHLSDCGWPALKVGLEQCCRFPWAGGEHPWLDVLVETGSHLIGIESKRYEPFRERETVDFSSAYRRGVWGDQMEPFVRVMERLSDGSLSYLHLDAEQLVKHAFGLRTEATRRGKTPARTEATRRKKTPALMYLYAQPKAWPDGRAISAAERDLHTEEVKSFAREVAFAEVSFVSCSYRELLAAFAASALRDVRDHGLTIANRFLI